MAGKKKGKGGSKKCCPKTARGKKVHVSKGKCWTKSSVKKAACKRGGKGKGAKRCPKGVVKRGPRKGRCRK